MVDKTFKYVEDGLYEVLANGKTYDYYYLGHYFCNGKKIWCIDILPGKSGDRQYTCNSFRITDTDLNTTAEDFHIKYKSVLDETFLKYRR